MNLHFSAKVVYALVALDHIGDGVTNLQDIASKHTDEGISLNFLEQIMRTLRDAKLVGSVRGPGGGYTLMRSANHITVRDVVEAFEAKERSDRFMPEKIAIVEMASRMVALEALSKITVREMKSFIIKGSTMS